MGAWSAASERGRRAAPTGPHDARRWELVLALCALATYACSGDTPGNERGGGAGGSGAQRSSSGGSGGSGGDDAFGNASEPNMPVQSEPPRPGDLRADCVGETQGAQRVQVDMYVMLDRSRSMIEDNGSGETKWDAVRAALTSFVSDPESEGLGVGLQYFPIADFTDVPGECTTDADCGTGGPCTARACRPPRVGNAPFQTCLVDADCPPNSPGCAPFGQCSGDPTFACFDIGPGGCMEVGDCNALEGQCLLYASCEIAEYAAPAVPIDPLPGNAMALIDSLGTESPSGLTPTPVAMLGALQQCSDHAAAHPTHRVIAVLATDGFPTDCVPLGVTSVDEAVVLVGDIAADGLARAPAVETYVIGVFHPDEPGAMQNLDLIARAGGTERAFIVDPTKDVSQQFLDALSEIRGGTLACEFNLPDPPEGKEIDFNLVNVELTDPSGTRSLVYVESQGRCGESELGWFYDVVPDDGTPTKISVCSTTCDTLRAATQASVEIRLGCPPVTPI